MKNPITDFIPQRAPIVMIDELVSTEQFSATTALHISPDNIFAEAGQFSEAGMIENIAQTAAAMVGYHSKFNNTPVPVGFIAAVKNWKLNMIPKIDTTIETTIRVINSVMDVSIVEGVIRQNNLELCSCEMRILVKKTPLQP